MVLSWRQFSPPGLIRQCLKTLLVVAAAELLALNRQGPEVKLNVLQRTDIHSGAVVWPQSQGSEVEEA